MFMAGCASLPPASHSPAATDSIADRWHAPLPPGGQWEDLRRWWSTFDDPTLLSLIDAAQTVSPTIAQAGAAIADARAQWVAHGAALQPSLDVNARSGRGRVDLDDPTGTVSSIGLMASWELDLFGGNRAGQRGAQARLTASRANWHAARVAVAAEVAMSYSRLRACEALLLQVQQDEQSRAQTSRLTALAADAGLESRVTADLASASAAQGTTVRIQQQARCDLWIKALVALSARDERDLRRAFVERTALLPGPAAIQIAAVPAQVLVQRPDIQAAEQEVVAASAGVAQADAQRLPRVSLTGSIGIQQLGMGGVRTDGRVWQIGPVAVTMPLFDGGRGRANAEAARVRHQAATTIYAGTLREAIQEVEGALVELQSATERRAAAQAAADGFSRSFLALQSRYQAGMASLLELEDARRSKVSAQRDLIGTDEQQVLAWITLYRALGGGWDADAMQRISAVSRASQQIKPVE
ncbi:efflux transporter outer membrane subunit [Verticiella sediminum]|nr:efflux transporter outer membrane subunit [Verticiella sediminum]